MNQQGMYQASDGKWYPSAQMPSGWNPNQPQYGAQPQMQYGGGGYGGQQPIVVQQQRPGGAGGGAAAGAGCLAAMCAACLCFDLGACLF